MPIKAIDSESVHRITSGQVVIDLASCVKELVENSLDAHATSIDIRFKNTGLDSVEVVDNGDGIPESDFESIALKYHTSKLSSFEELTKVSTFGFRGEAVSSLCSLANVSITTCTKDPLANKLIFDRYGNITSKNIVSGKKGTTVTISNIFDTLPVRRKDFERNTKREIQKAYSLLQAYAIICTGVKISVTAITVSSASKSRKSLVFASNGNQSLKQNIVNIFGASAINTLMALDLSFVWGKTIVKIQETNDKQTEDGDDSDYMLSARMTGFISMPIFGHGRTSGDRQLYFINSRPCLLPQVSKAINDVYKQFNSVQLPFVVANIEMNPGYYDVNVSPDKRTILLHYEASLIENLKTSLIERFETAGHSVPSNTQSAEKVQQKEIALNQQNLSFLSRFKRSQSGSQTQLGMDNEEKKMSDTVIEMSEGEIEGSQSNDEVESSSETQLIILTENDASQKDETAKITDLHDIFGASNARNGREPEVFSEPNNSVNLGEVDFDESNKLVSEVFDHNTNQEKYERISNYLRPMGDEKERKRSYEVESVSKNSMNNVQAYESEVAAELKPSSDDSLDTKDRTIEIKIGSDQVETVPFQTPKPRIKPSMTHFAEGLRRFAEKGENNDEDNMEIDSSRIFSSTPSSRNKTLNSTSTMVISLENIRNSYKHKKSSEAKRGEGMGISTSDLSTSQQTAESLLNLYIHKQDFNSMKVIGQFNLGFLIVAKDRGNVKDLFIVDQHASDEKFNFERLQREAKFKQQPLVVPRQLELSAVDEITIENNMHVIEANGFKVDIDPGAEPGRKCKLVSLPYYNKTMFNESDLTELVYLIQESASNGIQQDMMIRCSKTRTMHAMRACRSSIMIGDPLTLPRMTRVVQNLATLNKPWNCPHGRPTLRHLTTIDEKWGIAS